MSNASECTLCHRKDSPHLEQFRATLERGNISLLHFTGSVCAGCLPILYRMSQSWHCYVAEAKTGVRDVIPQQPVEDRPKGSIPKSGSIPKKNKLSGIVGTVARWVGNGR